MKNRLFCLVLCLLMAASAALTGCSSKTTDEVVSDITVITSANARTLTMWMVSEQPVDEETQTRITKAVNDITQSKFKAKMVLYFLTDAEYRDVVTNTIRASEDSKSIFTDSGAKEEETTAAESGTVEEETEIDKYGRVTIKYPDLKANQVDLVYIAGEDMFREYVANGWLKQLDEELSASSKKIKEYVSQTLLSASKLNGGTYAVPNNNIIGEYTYMLLNRQIAEKYGTSGSYDEGNVDGFFNEYIYSLLDLVRAEGDSSVVPVDASYDDVLNLLAHYWSINADTYQAESDRFSLLGYRYTDPKKLSRGTTVLSFQSLLGDATFRKNYYELNRMRLEGGYFGSADGKTAAVKFETGSLDKYNAYLAEDSEYLPVIVKYPSVDVSDVYANMFGVCSYTADLPRSMQILTYLTTNADFRNLLQYGVAGEDYKVVKDANGNETVERLQEKYMMNIFKTGNAFIAYPDPAQKLSADVWEIGKQQNRQALIEPLLNFDFAALAKASGAADSSTPKVGASGYTYSWTTGYSREVLSQNALLKAWMDAADQTGKGVYVLHTCASNSGQNLSAMVYYYNNNITNAKVEVTDGDGAVNVSYTGSTGNGYEITVINFYGKKNSSKLKWNGTVGGQTSEAKIKYQNSMLSFDALNTGTYSVSLNQGLTKAMVSGNAAALAWLSGKTGSNAFQGSFVADNSEGGKTYTYLVYVPSINAPYSVNVMPTGTDKTLNLAVNYTTDSAGKLGDTKYALFLVTVRADADVKVNFNLNGLTATDAVFENDPRLAFCGALDVELVKYFESLARQVEDMVNTAATKTGATEADVENLKNLIEDLGVLFKVRKNEPIDVDAVKAELLAKIQSDAVKALIEKLDLSDFYFKLSSATSSSEVHHKVAEEKDGGPTGKYVDATTDPTTGEAYHYYQSPYAIYYAWLKSNGFITK